MIEGKKDAMPGFYGFVSDRPDVLEKKLKWSDFVTRESGFIDEEAVIQVAGLYGRFFRHATKKFIYDKTFSEDAEHFFILDGVVLNKQKLMKHYRLNAETEMVSLLQKMKQTAAAPFFKNLRGSFAGVVLEKETARIAIYTNHMGDKEVFYYMDQETNTLYFATDFDLLIKLVHVHSGKTFRLNKNASYSLMTHGHTLCNETLFDEVKRLTPGSFLVFSSRGLMQKSYYEIQTKVQPIEEDKALEKLDTLFRSAVRLSFEKDLEYGYKHLVALSGGLDSRMTTWVAHEMGYTDMLNYTFSQSNYLDETVANKIADKLHHEWLFKSLDNGLYLYKYFDEAVRISGARAQSSTVSHTLSLLKNVNLDRFGLVHTGQLGDVIIGTYYDDGKQQGFKRGDGAVSTKLLDRVCYTEEQAVNLSDQELFKFYNRGFTGINIGLKPMYQFTETISPFLDVEFLDFCLSLPFEYRSGHALYLKWINRYYPGAANFVYEKVQGKINRKVWTVRGVPIPWTSFPKAVGKFLKKKLGLRLNTKKHMNPVDYWYKQNPELQAFYEERFERGLEVLKDKQLKQDCMFLFENGTAQEKDQVVTFLAFVEQMQQFMQKK